MPDEPPSIAAAELAQRLRGPAAPVVLDVRRRAAFEAAEQMVIGARWRDPDAVGAWAPKLAPDAEIVVYCVHGHEVSQDVTAHLRALGFDARFVAGGIEDYLAAGGDGEPTPAPGGGAGPA